MKITFIGCGNMAKAIIGGLIKGKIAAPSDITATARTEESLKKAEELFGICTRKNNAEAVEKADVVILAVKPQMMADVLEEIKDNLTKDQLIISIAAGRAITFFEEILGTDKKIVRVMPNTPAMVSEGMSAWCGNGHVLNEDKEIVKKIFSSFGIEEEVPEKLIDSACCVSGCGPAYVYMFIEALSDAAVAEGMPRKQAYRFASQTVLGSAKMVLETGKHPGELKDMVTSPGGSTIAGVQKLEEKAFRGTVIEAIRSASEKSRSL